MVRLIITVILAVGLVTAAFFEQSFINNTYDKLESDLTAFTAVLSEIDAGDKDAVKAQSNVDAVGAMYDYWLKKEKTLSLITRHSDLLQISDALIYIKNFIEFGNKEEAFSGIQRLQYLIDAHTHNMGANIVNVI
jgi:hypothetical protein